MLKVKRADLLFLFGFMVAGIACFYDVLSLVFFSDDYFVMHRLTVENQLFTQGFFRPLADVTLLVNHFFDGYNTWGYRAVNVLIHSVNSFLLYKVILRAEILPSGNNKAMAIIGGVLFLTYPFHAEPIIWIVGRSSMLACSFALWALYVFVGNKPYRTKMSLICALYFIGLTSYENIIVLPGIIFLAVLYKDRKLSSAVRYVVPLAVTLVIHLIVRWLVSGAIVGQYGEVMFGEEQTNYGLKFFKSFGRLLVYPLHSSMLLAILFSLVYCLVLVSFWLVWRYKKDHIRFCLFLWSFLLTAHLIPTMFGIDTHTSDGERLLYFPSFFLCGIIAFLVCLFIKNKTTLWTVGVCLLIYNLYLLQAAKNNWKVADGAIRHITTNLAANTGTPKYIVNMPDGIEGSFVFRNGFREAMVLNNIADDNIYVVNYLKNKEAILLDSVIVAHNIATGKLNIPPGVRITSSEIEKDSLTSKGTVIVKIPRKPGSLLYYWNRRKLVPLP